VPNAEHTAVPVIVRQTYSGTEYKCKTCGVRVVAAKDSKFYHRGFTGRTPTGARLGILSRGMRNPNA
jgi:hypothetical protein